MAGRKTGVVFVTYEVFITPTALEMLQGIPDARLRKIITERIDKLSVEPEKQGKSLLGELSEYRSIRVVGQRYRIIFKIERDRVVIIIAVGVRKEGDRKDIYNLAKKLFRMKLLE